ncbi:JAB domain-containing protein [Sphingomonas sp. H39-1-10]|uniref:JAB domain-containing protein n=1 Tax=Sphingomonas TaxID=13687 RepID=UPI00088AF4A3|nr:MULTISPECIES: JAB domain-containing protein [Sphingomonas]MDF0490873.1 JAB domain-containing protein [Sphingomonas pollutisoli]SDA21894.1 DNA repair protein RadC [Sphingomonas sp. NFR15]
MEPPSTPNVPPGAPFRRLDAEHVAIALFAPIRDLPVEVAMSAYVDPEWRLLGIRTRPSNETDMVELPIRMIVGDALAFDAAGVVMAHNHPSGDPTPSEGDRVFTRRLARALDGVGVRLIDHLVLAAGETASFRRIGLL